MTAANFWEENGLEKKTVELLADVTYYEPDRHFGRPFLTAYQLVILLKERFWKSSDVLVTGSGKGFRHPVYFCESSSRAVVVEIKNGEVTKAEGGFCPTGDFGK